MWQCCLNTCNTATEGQCISSNSLNHYNNAGFKNYSHILQWFVFWPVAWAGTQRCVGSYHWELSLLHMITHYRKPAMIWITKWPLGPGRNRLHLNMAILSKVFLVRCPVDLPGQIWLFCLFIFVIVASNLSCGRQNHGHNNINSQVLVFVAVAVVAPPLVNISK